MLTSHFRSQADEHDIGARQRRSAQSSLKLIPPSSISDSLLFIQVLKNEEICIMPTLGITDLPVEVMLDVLLPILPNRDLVALGATNKKFANICNDDTFWKLKCDTEFNFTGLGTARKTGWKFIYKGLTKPKAYVWGYVCSLFCEGKKVNFRISGTPRTRGWDLIDFLVPWLGVFPFPFTFDSPRRLLLILLPVDGARIPACSYLNVY